MTEEGGLQRLASLFGIERFYHDIWGKQIDTTDETRRSFLNSMGVNLECGNFDEILFRVELDGWRKPLAPSLVFPQKKLPAQISVRIPSEQRHQLFSWEIKLENGGTHHGEFRPETLPSDEVRDFGSSGRFERFRLTLPANPPEGYHRFTLTFPNKKSFSAHLIITPNGCYTPESFNRGEKAWGPAVQLYALRSKNNWGMGDFTDLAKLVAWCGSKQADLIGLNPLHELFPQRPNDASPYSPSSRLGINILYIDVEATDDFENTPEAQAEVKTPRFQEKLAALRKEHFVDYTGVSELKLPVLRMLYDRFLKAEWKKKTARAKKFGDFVKRGGKGLECLTTFEALQEHFWSKDQMIWGWPVWPEDFRSPESPSVKTFAKTHSDQIRFYQYLQWLADIQLDKIKNLCEKQKLGIGLYFDLSVSVDRGGAEVWTNQSMYALDISVGAPPDDLNAKGQNWGLPPFIPSKLQEAGYQPFVEILRSNMRYAGALRIDHAMQLTRLFWIPPFTKTADGATYVRYPLDDLMAVLALESTRNRCLVIGEDLGTVPDHFRTAMEEWSVFSYKVFLFEKTGPTEFKPAAQYARLAAVTLGSHDLPTLAGYWRGRDLELRDQLQLYPNEDLRRRIVGERDGDRRGILSILQKENLLPKGMSTDPTSIPEINPELASAVYRFLARTPSKIQLLQFEDLIGETEQSNLPGTTDQHPNWRRKLKLNVEEFSEDPRLNQAVESIKAERPRGS